MINPASQRPPEPQAPEDTQARVASSRKLPKSLAQYELHRAEWEGMGEPYRP